MKQKLWHFFDKTWSKGGAELGNQELISMCACTQVLLVFWSLVITQLMPIVCEHEEEKQKKCHGDTSPLIWLLLWCTIFSCSVFTFRAAAFSSALVQHTYLSLPSAIWTTGWRWKLGNRTPSLFRISQQYNMRGNGKSDNECMSTKLRTICIVVHHVWTGVHKDFPLSFHFSLAHSENPFNLISFPYLKQITVDQCFTI